MANIASDEWIKALAGAIGASADVRANAASWGHGPISLTIAADDAKSFVGASIVLELRDGTLVASAGPRLTPFEFTGSLDRWEAIFGGKSTMVDAALESKLSTRGDLPSLVRHRTLLDAVAAAAGSIETTWPAAPEPAKA